ncbi:hypothetical protein QUB33_05910 [Microcoleus sp. B3-A4]|uniref:hypothetical protein n=1 Tax=Microcoleus sp. B3-A4 TaxID=2818653 RepID=UPI002FD16C8B
MTDTTDKIVYDLIQRFEIVDGVPKLISSQIHSIEGGTNLFSIAECWMAKNTKLERFNKQQYVAYKKKGEKRYQLVLTPRASFLQVSFAPSSLSGKIHFETESDLLFPYALRVAIDNKETLIQLLNDLFYTSNKRTET